MRLRQVIALTALLGLVCVPAHADDVRDIIRDTLAPNDGWAAADGGTTGGSNADDAHVFTVRNRSELVRALDGGSSTPKTIRVAGTIEGLLDITNASDLVKSWNGTGLHQSGTLWGSPRTESGGGYPVDLLAIHNAHNSGSERDLTADVGWTPTLHTKIDSAATADRAVAHGAGAGRIP
ncbi:hypothetical protein [Streptomyces sp. NBC_00299]|uniref:hypothetical protein n=1 Tax=Streptomyces sp. NBC_00299 TaxID=2975705 RepID=UPI002E2C836F|nr:hypothetical protein [Streptomyces sp. NBC_00299]